MARKKADDRPIPKDDPSRIIQTTMEDVMHASMIPYAEHVILERALPRVEDGLKPVQRRILYTMLELGTTPDKPHRKCARIVGDCLGKYHPHGDSSVYDALVRMAQDFVMRVPMVDGHGNFGSIDGDGAAAMRYTEARMAPPAMLMLQDIEKDTVPFRLNFDDTLKEPDLLPARFPNLLVNGANGIAVGLATSIPPHNLGEAVSAAIAIIENPDISLDELMKIIPGPDFPTGGVLVDNEEIRLGYETGRARLTVRARVHIEEGRGGRRQIVIDEVPYQVNKGAMLARIMKLREEKKGVLTNIVDVADASDFEGMRAIIELKKDADPDKVLAALYRYSDMQVTFGVNMVAIAGGKPVQLGLKPMLEHFIAHQKNVVTRRTQYDLRQAEARAHILEGLIIAVDNLDEVIRLIRASKTVKEARQALMDHFPLDEIQAQAILDMRLQRLTNLEVLNLRKEYEEIQKTIKRLRGILESEKKLMQLIARELREVADQFATPRKTVIAAVSTAPLEAADTEQPPDEAVVVLTGAGQLKRFSPSVLRKNPLPSPAEDEREAARFLAKTDTSETVFLFTGSGVCHTLPVSQITECRPKDRGQLLSGLIPGWEAEETVVGLFCAKKAEMEKRPDLVFLTEGGQLKRTAAGEYSVKTRKFAAISLKKDDRLMAVLPLAGDDDLLLLSRRGYAIRYALSDIEAQGRATAGAKGLYLGREDVMLFMAQIRDSDTLILVSDRGNAKRLACGEIERMNGGNKNGKAVFLFNRDQSNGSCIAGFALSDGSPADLLITQRLSPPTRLPLDLIPLQPKSGRGFPVVMAILDDVVTGAELADFREREGKP